MAKKNGPKRQQPGSVKVRIAGKVPPIVGYADSYSVIERARTSHELVFFDSASRSVLVRITVDEGPLAEHLWGPTVEFFDSSSKVLEQHELQPVPPTATPPSLVNTKSTACNLFRIFRTGTQAAFEAYYVSPGSVHLAATGVVPQPIHPEPICHVQLSLPVLMGLLEEVRRLVSNSPTVPEEKRP